MGGEFKMAIAAALVGAIGFGCDDAPAPEKVASTQKVAPVAARGAEERVVLDAPFKLAAKDAERMGPLLGLEAATLISAVESAPGVVATLPRAEARRAVRELKAVGGVARYEDASAKRTWLAPGWASFEPDGEATWSLAEERYLRRDELSVDLLPVLELQERTEDGREELREFAFEATGFTRKDGGFVLYAEAKTHLGLFRYRVESEKHDPRVFVFLASKLKRDASLSRVSLRHLVKGAAFSAVGQNLRWEEVEAGHASRAHTPKMLRLSDARGAELIWSPDEFVDGVHVRDEGFAIDVLDAEMRPFETYESCGSDAGGLPPTRARGASVLPRGTKLETRYDFVLGSADVPMVGRYPNGAQAAVSISDHGDPAGLAALKALAESGLPLTYAAYLDGMPRAEVDAIVGPTIHLAANGLKGASNVQTVAAALDRWKGVSTWVDHEPGLRCDAVVSQGWNPDSKHYVLETLGRRGIDALWAGRNTPGSFDLLADGERGVAAWFHPDLRWRGHDFAMYRTTFSGESEEVASRLGRGGLGELIARHALVSLAIDGASDPAKPHGLLREDDGGLRPRAEIQELAGRLAERKSEVWTGEVGKTMLHVLRAQQVRVVYLPAGFIRVRNMSHTPLEGLTLWVDAGTELVALDGDPVASRVAADENRRAVWFRVPARGERLLRWERGDVPFPYLAPQKLVVE